MQRSRLTSFLRWLLVLFFSSTSFLASAQTLNSAQAQQKTQTYRLALVNSYGHSILMDYYSETLAALSESIFPHKIIVTEYDPDTFLKAAEKGEFDMSIASSGLTSLMIERSSGIPLMAVSSNDMPDPNRANGAAIIVRSGQLNLLQMEDLKDRSLAIMSRNAFAGWQIPAAELIKQGINPYRFFQEIRVVGAPMTKIVHMVKNGEVDVGFVATCLLERMADAGEIKLSDFRVINAHTDEISTCLHSTELYPGWFFSVKPSISTDIAKKITSALLNIPPDKNGVQWTIPTDHRRLYEIFKVMDVPLNDSFDYKWYFRKYRTAFVGLILVIIVILGNSLVLARLVRRTTRQLEVTMKEKLQAELTAQHSAMQVESLTRASAIGSLSSMVAHELKQPLTVIGNYAGSLKRRLKRGDVSKETLISSLDEIEDSDLRAVEIIDRVRAYGKLRSRNFLKTDLSELVEKAIVRWRRYSSNPVPCRYDIEPNVTVEADRLEIELAIINLLKNAATAVSVEGVDYPLVEINMKTISGYAIITVKDNGPDLPEETVKRIGEVGYTTKSNGLGLGLSIVRTLLEAHGGSLTIAKRTDLGGRGLCCTVRLPLPVES